MRTIVKKNVLPLILLAALVATAAANPAKHRMTVDDSLNITKVKDVRITPDGTKIFYAKQTLDWAKNKYTNTYFMCDADGNNKRVFIKKGTKAHTFTFSPDGKYLGFLSEENKEKEGKAGKKEQLFLIRVDGGEAFKLTSHATGVNDYKWLPDGSGLVFTADEARTPDEQKEYELGADAVFVDEAPNGKENARFHRLIYFNLETKKGILHL